MILDSVSIKVNVQNMFTFIHAACMQRDHIVIESASSIVAPIVQALLELLGTRY